jgi:hypothetical protein
VCSVHTTKIKKIRPCRRSKVMYYEGQILRNVYMINPLFIKNKCRVISSEGLYALKKNAVLCSQRAMLLIQSVVTACCKYSNGRLAHLFFTLNLLGWVWQPAADYSGCLACFGFKKSAPNGHYYLQRAVTSDQITQQNSLQKAGGP